MGRLAGFTYRTAARKLRNLGFGFDRSAKGSHELWFNEATGDIPEGTMKAIVSQAGLSVDEYLDA